MPIKALEHVSPLVPIRDFAFCGREIVAANAELIKQAQRRVIWAEAPWQTHRPTDVVFQLDGALQAIALNTIRLPSAPSSQLAQLLPFTTGWFLTDEQIAAEIAVLDELLCWQREHLHIQMERS